MDCIFARLSSAVDNNIRLNRDTGVSDVGRKRASDNSCNYVRRVSKIRSHFSRIENLSSVEEIGRCRGSRVRDCREAGLGNDGRVALSQIHSLQDQRCLNNGRRLRLG